MRQPAAQKGFTLIELLIVIVIIGILAGIVITVLNPRLQQARAKDSVIIATMNKAAVESKSAASSDVSGNANFHTCSSLVASLQNVTGGTCPSTASGTGTFTVTGVTDTSGSPVTFNYRWDNTANPKTFCLSTKAVVNDVTPTTGQRCIRASDTVAPAKVDFNADCTVGTAVTPCD